MECHYCHKQFGAKCTLLRHQQTAKFCIKIQAEIKEKIFLCSGCNKEMVSKQRLQTHHQICEKFLRYNTTNIDENKNSEIELKDAIIIFKDNTIQKLEQHVKELEQHVKELEDKIVKIAMRHTTKTNINIQQNFTPITDEKLSQDSVKFTKEYLVQGGQGIARFSLDNTLKDNIICTDIVRGHSKYLDPNGDFVLDPYSHTIVRRVCSSIIEPAEKINLDVKSTLTGETSDSALIRAVLIDETVNNIKQCAKGIENELTRDFAKTISSNSVKKLT